MSKREKCRFCGATLRHDKTLDQYDPEYCSGLCRKKDGAEPYVKTAKEQTLVVTEAKLTKPASFKDYEKNVGGRYVRRFKPEELNWGEPMSDGELLQAGFRANREPLKGDWDYQDIANRVNEAVGYDLLAQSAKLNEWGVIRARAKELNIQTYGKKREQVEAEIKEAENAK